jgi:hypothetical protein
MIQRCHACSLQTNSVTLRAFTSGYLVYSNVLRIQNEGYMKPTRSLYTGMHFYRGHRFRATTRPSSTLAGEDVIYRVVDARHYVTPGADRPPAAARALAEYIVRLSPP